MGSSTARKNEFDLRQYFGKQKHILNGGTGNAVADVYAMILAISSKGFQQALRSCISGPEIEQPAIDLVEAIAECLSRKATPARAEVFQKALQEALLDAGAMGRDPERMNLKVRLENYLRKRGASQFLEMFLSRYVFNALWIEIQEPVRKKEGSEALDKYVRRLTRFCTSVVKSVVGEWQAEGKLDELARKKRLGKTLIQTIETRLLENPA